MSDMIQLFKKAFEKPLPGKEAQEIMSPTVRFTGHIHPDRTKARESSVFLLIYKNENNKWVIPFIKRPEYDGVHSGQVSFPGGKCEEFDASYLDTAFRETEEEIGIKRDQIEFVGALSSIYIPNSNFMVYPQVGILRNVPVFTPDPHEVEKILEVEIDSFFDMEKRYEFIREVRGVEIIAPYFAASGQKIWGATAMMMSEFVEFVKQNAPLLNLILHSCNDCNVPKYQ